MFKIVWRAQYTFGELVADTVYETVKWRMVDGQYQIEFPWKLYCEVVKHHGLPKFNWGNCDEEQFSEGWRSTRVFLHCDNFSEGESDG